MQEFKKCTVCGQLWPSRETFLDDRDVKLVGYQANFGTLELGFFLFNHDACRGTLAIHPLKFRDLYNGPVYEERQTENPECPKYCLHEEELRRCMAKCECAYVREIMQVVKDWPQKTAG